jgi:RNA polymerase sigma-70 factor, ECF subfamily
MDQPNCEIVRAALGGDLSAFTMLYDRYAPLIRAICFDITADFNDAQDLTQETFLRAYKNLTTLENVERFDAWLVGIARRICKEWFRDRVRERNRRTTLPDKTSTFGLPPDRFEALYSAIKQLPEDERLAIHVFYLEEQSIEQASGLLGYSRSGFYRLLDRARKRIGHLLRNIEEVKQ